MSLVEGSLGAVSPVAVGRTLGDVSPVAVGRTLGDVSPVAVGRTLGDVGRVAADGSLGDLGGDGSEGVQRRGLPPHWFSWLEGERETPDPESVLTGHEWDHWQNRCTDQVCARLWPLYWRYVRQASLAHWQQLTEWSRDRLYAVLVRSWQQECRSKWLRRRCVDQCRLQFFLLRAVRGNVLSEFPEAARSLVVAAQFLPSVASDPELASRVVRALAGFRDTSVSDTRPEVGFWSTWTRRLANGWLREREWLPEALRVALVRLEGPKKIVKKHVCTVDLVAAWRSYLKQHVREPSETYQQFVRRMAGQWRQLSTGNKQLWWVPGSDASTASST